MREIKFRAWDIEKKKMFKVALLGWFPLDGRLSGIQLLDSTNNTYDIFIDRIQNCILMQYTGLKDQNDREIYEADIIKDPEEHFFSVEWDYHTSGFFLKSSEDDEYNMEMNHILNNDNIKIIGNLYENPKALEKDLA